MHRSFVQVGTADHPNSSTVDFHNAGPGEHMSVFATCLHRLKDETEPIQVVSYFLSCIVCYIPALKDKALEALSNQGATVRQVNTNQERAQAGIEIQPLLLPTTMHVYLGQCLFMSKRTNALKSITCASTEVGICLPFEKAQIIRSTLSTCFRFRKQVKLEFMAVADKHTSLVCAVCNYVCKILGWRENDHRYMRGQHAIPVEDILKEMFAVEGPVDD